MMTPRVGLVIPVLAAVAAAQLPPTPAPSRDAGPAAPRLFVAQRVIDLGHIVEGEKVELQWRIENHGNAVLRIERTKSACGCTVVSLGESDRRVLPGQSIELHAEFNSQGRPGEQVKSITVFTNDPEEPELKLELRATVDRLYVATPQGVVNLRSLRRGEAASKTIDFSPVGQHGSIEIRSVALPDDAPIRIDSEPLEGVSGGRRLRVRVREDAAVGPIRTQTVVHLTVGGVQRDHTATVRGDVVGDITWHPKWINDTANPSLPGKRFAPILLNAPAKRPVSVLGVDAGPRLSAAVEPPIGSGPTTRHRVTVQLHGCAPPGPFGSMVRVLTDCLDQPVVEVPVYAVVAPAMEVDPPVVLLRDDGTPAGTRRRIALRAWPAKPLEVTGVSCSIEGVSATVEPITTTGPLHVRYLDVVWSGAPGGASREGTLMVTTTGEATQTIEIPVRVLAP